MIVQEKVKNIGSKYMDDKERLNKIKKIADSWHEERYNADWDTLQSSLMKIWKLTNAINR